MPSICPYRDSRARLFAWAWAVIIAAADATLSLTHRSKSAPVTPPWNKQVTMVPPHGQFPAPAYLK